MVWKPEVTVAAVIEREGRFLLVEEETSDGVRLNQPAGHLEPDETIIDAVVRETLEETAYEFTPAQLLGIYRWSRPGSELSYLRFAFSGSLGQYYSERSLDVGILRTMWLNRDEIHASAERHRSPLVLRCVDDYLDGRQYAIDALIDCV